jgi:hypothetical protein
MKSHWLTSVPWPSPLYLHHLLSLEVDSGSDDRSESYTHATGTTLCSIIYNLKGLHSVRLGFDLPSIKDNHDIQQ